MTSPTTFDDTSTDYKRFEAEWLAQDHDVARQTADLTDTAARQFVNDLLVSQTGLTKQCHLWQSVSSN